MDLTLAVLKRLTLGLPPDTIVRTVTGRPPASDCFTRYRVFVDKSSGEAIRYWVCRHTHFTTPRLLIYAEQMSFADEMRFKPTNRLVRYDRVATPR